MGSIKGGLKDFAQAVFILSWAGFAFLFFWTNDINESQKKEMWDLKQEKEAFQEELKQANLAKDDSLAKASEGGCQKVVFVAKESSELEKPKDSMEEVSPGSSQELDPAYKADALAKIDAIKEEIRQLQELQKLASQDQTASGIVQASADPDAVIQPASMAVNQQ
ncbi:MAG: hypothetical protein WC926_00555 [Candidatus Paceibacterota bacterium]|jgi:hypothetical protein